MGRKRPQPPLHFHHLHLAFLFCCSFSVLCFSNSKNEPVGYGYRVRSVSFDPSGKSLTARLDLIKPSPFSAPTFGISFLLPAWKRMIVSEFESPIPSTKDGKSPEKSFPLHPTPPPSAPQNHSISPEDDHNSPENNIVSDPKSDLVFTLRRTTPFGFIVSRRSTGDILFDASSDASDAGTFLVFKDQYLRPPHPPLLPLWPRRAHQEDFQARPKPNADALEHRHPQLQP
ncbi:Alpha-glucosidase [Vitis vinifera]|uniref:Alpha-glucosidase n=1 Tax=Vitis vinifera TaxID=29760 RepID=A0A438E751_VITVI|nr:Alpha-glucosidase [Vitis vinifera]